MIYIINTGGFGYIQYYLVQAKDKQEALENINKALPFRGIKEHDIIKEVENFDGNCIEIIDFDDMSYEG